MTDAPQNPEVSEPRRQQVERMIIENRNEDGSYDVKGIANDVLELLQDALE